MKKILLAILVFFGLKTSAQVNYCDSISYGTSSTINYPLILSGSISSAPDSIDWLWSVCDNNMCYTGNGPNPSFGQVSITDTLKVCYDVIITINGSTYICSGCDSLTYNPNTYQWEKLMVQPLSIIDLKENTLNDGKTYDLLGREIFNIPKGTIYIKNRKKYIK
tara:strand:+ start:30 stop:521 length:492 start_codon:yes stop_codon:yes gene_type:complete